MEGKIHRWLSSGQRGCPGACRCARRHGPTTGPSRKEHPGIVVVGDYLFDSTLERACLRFPPTPATDHHPGPEMIAAAPYAEPRAGEPVSDKIDRSYFENYRGQGALQRGVGASSPIPTI